MKVFQICEETTMNILHEARVFYDSEVCWSYIHHYFIGSKTEACEDQSNLFIWLGRAKVGIADHYSKLWESNSMIVCCYEKYAEEGKPEEIVEVMA